MQEATKQQNIINGVNTNNLFETMDAIKGDRQIAKFNFRAKNEWVDGSLNRTTVNEYSGACQEFSRESPFVMEKDEPPVLLGNDRGPNPVEYVLAALAGCMTTGLVYHAAAQGIKIDSVESSYEGDLDLRGFLGMDETVRNGFENLNVTFKVKGDASPEKLRELVEISKQRSPVYDIVTNGVPVTVEIAE